MGSDWQWHLADAPIFTPCWRGFETLNKYLGSIPSILREWSAVAFRFFFSHRLVGASSTSQYVIANILPSHVKGAREELRKRRDKMET
jgi:hypothetical protein